MLAAGLAAVALLAGCGDDDSPPPPPSADEPSAGERGDGAGQQGQDLARGRGEPVVETWVADLEIPWELTFLPDGRALVTERPGRIRLISAAGDLVPEPAAEVPTAAIGEGGLLGLALDPEFRDNGLVYLYYTAQNENVVARYRLQGERLVEEAVVLDGIASSPIHNGGRIHFGPDDRLYAATGDAAREELAQDPDSPNGKILRLEPGQYRGDGPASPEVFTLGHRNPQGFDWQPRSERLISDEHGPDGFDEVNLIEEGSNYGWPEVVGADHGRFAAPLTVYEDSIAPSGATFVSLPGSEWTGDYLMGGLVGEQIRRLGFDGGRVTENEALFQGELGRIRTVVEGPDGALYALTSNRDGRGDPRPNDDRIVRIVPPAG